MSTQADISHKIDRNAVPTSISPASPIDIPQELSSDLEQQALDLAIRKSLQVEQEGYAASREALERLAAASNDNHLPDDVTPWQPLENWPTSDILTQIESDECDFYWHFVEVARKTIKQVLSRS